MRIDFIRVSIHRWPLKKVNRMAEYVRVEERNYVDLLLNKINQVILEQVSVDIIVLMLDNELNHEVERRYLIEV